MTRADNGFTGVGFLCVGRTQHRHRWENLFVLRRVGREPSYIRFITGDALFVLLDRPRIVLQQSVLQVVLLAHMTAFEQVELTDLHFKIALFNDVGVAGGKRLDLRVGQRRFVHIVGGAHRRFAGHNLRNKLLLVLHKLVKIAVKSTLGDITVNLHLGILVALPHNAPAALLQIRRPPRAIQIMQGNQAILNIGACAHFLRTAHQHTHITAPHFGEQLHFLCFGVGAVYVGDFLRWDAFGNQLVPNIVVDIETAVALWGGEVTEHKLRRSLLRRLLPDAKHICRADRGFAAFIVGQHGVDKPLIQRQFSAVVGDFQHIIHGGIDIALAYRFGALGKAGDHFLLQFRGFDDLGVVVCFRYGEIEHIRRLNIRHTAEHTHKFRQVIKLGKARLGAVSGAFRRKLDGGGGFPEGRRPGVKVLQFRFHQRVILQIPLHGVEFHHRIGDRCTGGKNCAVVVRQLVQIATFHKQVAGFLRLRLGDTADIAHLCDQKQVFEVVRFIHKNAVNAQFLKGNKAVLAALVVELFQLGLQRFTGFLHLLDGVVFAPGGFRFADTLNDLINLPLQGRTLALGADGYLLKLAMPDNHRVIIAGGDTTAEFLAVFRFKVALGGHKDICRRVQLQPFGGKLSRNVVGYDDHALAAQSQPLALHCRRYHFKGLACAYFVGKQGISAVDDMGDGVDLVLSQCDFGIDAGKADMAPVILTGTQGVETLVVKGGEPFPSAGVFPNPVLERLLDKFLLGLGDCRFLFVQHTLFVAAVIVDLIEDTDIPLI